MTKMTPFNITNSSTIKAFLACMVFFIYTFVLLIIVFKMNRVSQRFTQNNYTVSHTDILELTNIYYNFLHGRWRGISIEEQSNFSELGKFLFLEDETVHSEKEREYTILIWKQWNKLKRRHVMRYSKKSYDPFENCPVRNCLLKYTSTFLSSADLVIFDLNHIKSVRELPLKYKKSSRQIWAFLSDRSPLYTLPPTKNNSLSNFNGLFNWSMTYRMNSDIPVPYGRTIILKYLKKRPEMNVKAWSERKYQDVLVVVTSSSCAEKNDRWKYISELKKYLKVHVYGKCGDKMYRSCDVDSSESDLFHDVTSDCRNVLNYKFYLAFENSNCDEYITENLWWYGYSKNLIPIVMGGSKEYYDQLLPSSSFINVERFARPRDLANYILYLNNTPSDLQQYFAWRMFFKVVNEHGYFGTVSRHFCRACQALNYNNRSKPKIIKDLEGYWKTGKCHPSWIERYPK